ncbi:hypothetical protein [Tahibacter harae]|uniref:Sel1 repeat-containing protein n=1 Tax=Tahibacter harae TaxID=2963937 RepID=A0ABT1QPW2_9GAMM|nr:hypothetical protein [Tahibacter harae]MCQ4164328.1 hypothetical protein [Tahibacter harae]
MRWSALSMCFSLLLLLLSPAEASEIGSLFERNACGDVRVSGVTDAKSAYRKATSLIDVGEKELGKLYMACSVYLGGGAYLSNMAGYEDDSRALDSFLAAAVLGVDSAAQRAGELLLKQAKTERERLIGLALLSSSLNGCHGTALLNFHDEALKTKEPLALMEAYAWTKVRLSRSTGIPGAIATYTSWLDKFGQLMNAGMRELAEKRAAAVIGRGLDCSGRR